MSGALQMSPYIKRVLSVQVISYVDNKEINKINLLVLDL